MLTEVFLWYANVLIGREQDLLCISKDASVQSENLRNVLLLRVFFFKIQRKNKTKRGYWGDAEAHSENEYEWPLCISVSCLEDSAEQLLVCSFSSGLISFVWHWASPAVFIIDSTGAVEIRCNCAAVVITVNLFLLYFHPAEDQDPILNDYF